MSGWGGGLAGVVGRLWVGVVVGLVVVGGSSSLSVLNPVVSEQPAGAYGVVVEDSSLRGSVWGAVGVWESATGLELFVESGSGGEVALLVVDVIETELPFAAVAGRVPVDREPVEECRVSVNVEVPVSMREGLLVHELGHCLGLEHTAGGVMNPFSLVVSGPSGVEAGAVVASWGEG